MVLYIMRHGKAGRRDASRWPDDSQRPLSEAGRQEVRQVSNVLGRVVPGVDLLLSSDFQRARKSAEIVAEVCNWPQPERLAALESDQSEAILAALRKQSGRERIFIVGHEPSLGELVSMLLAGGKTAMEIDVTTAAVFAIDIAEEIAPTGGKLLWYLTPDLAGLS